MIKCNHGCGYNIIVKDKNAVNVEDISRQLDIWMKEDFWKVYCEPQYKNIKKKIFVEKYLGKDIHTYKFYCFNGVPKIVYVSFDGEKGEKDLYLDYFDMKWNWMPLSLDGHKHCNTRPKKPKTFDKMIKISKELSKQFPFVRVDLYEADGYIYFSEFTFIPTGGIMKIKPDNVLKEWGKWLDISDKM